MRWREFQKWETREEVGGTTGVTTKTVASGQLPPKIVRLGAARSLVRARHNSEVRAAQAPPEAHHSQPPPQTVILA